ncbi:YrhA family protein [Priestia endophytica]|uniref:YrhA family protein n=1 Tax=Priestia endophytica TaxID=135735 RepID=UPI00227FC09A|nr:YrhA family protein [Priestia endophytica]MCY8232239.1 YrhA family protein [Priestia endophytica]
MEATVGRNEGEFKASSLPKQYLNFLHIVNGLQFNGLNIYGVDKGLSDIKSEESIEGIIEMNELWHENAEMKKYIFFGDADISWYCYDMDENMYMELDKPSGTIVSSFDDFDFMLKNALEMALS